MEASKRLVRLYYYSDEHRGYGDAGTFRYVRMDEDCFSGIEKTAFNGEKYFNWNYSQKGSDFVRTIEGFSSYSMGFKFVTEEEYQFEVFRLNVQLQRITELVK
jgi:hypothetical protein